MDCTAVENELEPRTQMSRQEVLQSIGLRPSLVGYINDSIHGRPVYDMFEEADRKGYFDYMVNLVFDETDAKGYCARGEYLCFHVSCSSNAGEFSLPWKFLNVGADVKAVNADVYSKLERIRDALPVAGGQKVYISGLTSNTELNGVTGNLLGMVKSGAPTLPHITRHSSPRCCLSLLGRFAVHLPNATNVLLKPINLAVLDIHGFDLTDV